MVASGMSATEPMAGASAPNRKSRWLSRTWPQRGRPLLNSDSKLLMIGLSVATSRRKWLGASPGSAPAPPLGDLQHQRGVVGVKVLPQAGLDLREGLDASGRAQEPARKAVDAIGERVVVARHAHEFGQLLLQGCVFLAQHFHLALDERDRGAIARVLQAQSRQQLRMTIEQVGMLLQVLGDRLFVDRFQLQVLGAVACHPEFPSDGMFANA